MVIFRILYFFDVFILLHFTFIRNTILPFCLLYVTLAPCSMCKEVIKQSRIRKTFFILDKPGYKKEFSNSEFLKSNYHSEQMYAAILSAFFKEKR